MAEIVLGIGTSHSPMLSIPYEDFDQHAIRDSRNPQISNFEQRAIDNESRMAPFLTPEVTQQRYAETQEAIKTLSDRIGAADIDVMIIVGDDQGEWFDKDNMPALAIYWGETVENRPPNIDEVKPWLKSGYWAYHGDGTNRTFPIDAKMGRTLIEDLVERGFDVHQIRHQPDNDEPFGHAWGFVQQRLLGDKVIPIVPIMLNTYFPPNQPTAGRCWDLGVAVREIVESLPDDLRVAVVGSGGLSHYVVDEELDLRLLNHLKDRNRDGLAAMQTAELQSGTSEARNWIVAGGAANHLSMEVVSYIPFYRSPAGSGCGMAFAVWS